MTINKQNLGWVVAAAVVFLGTALGFQDKAEKIGVVDMNRVISDSELGKKNQTTLQTALAARQDLLEFIKTYKVLTTDQANKLRELSLKPVVSEADKAEINRIRKEVIDADTKRNQLLQKSNPTDADRLALQDYNNRAQTMNEVYMRWSEEFQGDLDNLESQIRTDTVAKAKQIVKDVSKSQGYSVVFEASYAPYGANDLTDAGIKALNAAK